METNVDDNYRNELQKHLTCLQHQGIVETWHDRRIISGEKWADRIGDELRQADIILLLISSASSKLRYFSTGLPSFVAA
jgi:hypothetical protein